jgi:hypothetical protein
VEVPGDPSRKEDAMTWHRKALAAGLVTVAFGVAAAPAAANDGITVRADEDPDFTASAKVHLDSGAPLKETISFDYPN